MITVIRETFRAGMKELAIKPTLPYLGQLTSSETRPGSPDSPVAATRRRDDEALKYIFIYTLKEPQHEHSLTGQT